MSFLMRGECVCADSTMSTTMLGGLLVLVHATPYIPLPLYLLLTPTLT
jgi:hypothetical protein